MAAPPQPSTSKAASGNAASPAATPPASPAPAAESAPRRSSWRKRLLISVLGAALVVTAAYFAWPMLSTMWSTISTDDAYVNGHVTFVAARVPGQVLKVLVDD